MNYQETSIQEIIEIIPSTECNNHGIWKPVVEGVTEKLLNQLEDSGINSTECDNIQDEAIAVLSKCVPPSAQTRHETGLVVGYVQSGKTMSFTTVAALARDNGYQMVIVIAGTSLNLLSQSTNRLEEDLSLLTKSDRRWQHFKSSEFDEGDHIRIKNVIDDWKDPTVPKQDRQTILITIMKHHQHLKALADILSKIETSEVSTLIIDDEADQASLNTKVKKGDTSTTYQRILSLREYLPNHTFLQYTATPQAPLLINLIDVLSPKFVKVLTPGEKYTGGKVFFQDGTNLVCTIPENEIPTKSKPLNAPPESLLHAMRVFFLGVAAGMILENGTGNRSMMVHPSHKTIGHKQYYYWVEQVKNHWHEILQPESDSLDRLDLLEEFAHSYKILQQTVAPLPTFEKLSSRLLHAIRRTELHEVNSTSGRTPNIPWERQYSHILVGGQAMDRGFTVEGITVTYMPRGAGIGNADTIQQRARFFGYKQAYLGYCRVFLEDRVRAAYRDYVIHEEDVRTSLISHEETGNPLDTWRRAFFLDRSLKPTRDNVLGLDYIRGNLGSQWYTPKAPHASKEAIAANSCIVEEFVESLSFQEDVGSPDRTESQIHNVTDAELKYVYEQLLVPFRVGRSSDSEKFTGVRLQIGAYLESHPDELCTVYHMSKGNPRKRSLENDEIPTLFQGKNPKTGRVTYPGDRNIKSKYVTIQIHNLEIVRENRDVITGVPALAIWLPKGVSPDWLVQDQGGTEIRH